MATFALVADTDVFHIFRLSEEHPAAVKWTAALRSGVELVDVSNYGVEDLEENMSYVDSMFYSAPDVPIEPSGPSGLCRYAGVIEGKIMGFITFMLDEMPEWESTMVKAGLATDFQVVEAPDNVGIMWTWDGTEFAVN